MKKLYFDLVFTKPKKNDLPFSPIGQIILKLCEKQNDQIVLGAKCNTFKDLNDQICWLENELKIIRKEAKSKFNKN